jgi:hypothetical protein
MKRAVKTSKSESDSNISINQQNTSLGPNEKNFFDQILNDSINVSNNISSSLTTSSLKLNTNYFIGLMDKMETSKESLNSISNSSINRNNVEGARTIDLIEKDNLFDEDDDGDCLNNSNSLNDLFSSSRNTNRKQNLKKDFNNILFLLFLYFLQVCHYNVIIKNGVGLVFNVKNASFT